MTVKYYFPRGLMINSAQTLAATPIVIVMFTDSQHGGQMKYYLSR